MIWCPDEIILLTNVPRVKLTCMPYWEPAMSVHPLMLSWLINNRAIKCYITFRGSDNYRYSYSPRLVIISYISYIAISF